MNDTQHVEAARALAAQTLKSRTQRRDRIDHMFRTVLARFPDDREQQELSAAFVDFHARYAANPADAEALIRVGQSQPDPTLAVSELAAYTMLANLILNLDEAITRN